MGDPAGLRDQVDALFMQWAQLSEEQPAEKQHNGFVAQLQQAGFLKVLFRPSITLQKAHPPACQYSPTGITHPSRRSLIRQIFLHLHSCAGSPQSPPRAARSP